mmetsp:Transcript_98606/g.205584  ORF Transcript_98606/g.205584 Transcript_98606/m.205584 type:complete len:492 (-) Transcript_98606:72-1547(-)
MTVVRVQLPNDTASHQSASPVSGSDLDPNIASTLLSAVPPDLAASAVAASESVATTFAETHLATASSREREDSVTGSSLGESMASSAQPNRDIEDLLRETVSVFSSQCASPARARVAEPSNAPGSNENPEVEGPLLSLQRSFRKEFERLTQSQEALRQHLDQAFAEIDGLKAQGLQSQPSPLPPSLDIGGGASNSTAWRGDLQRLEAQMWDLERWVRELHDRDETTRARHLLTSGQDLLNLQDRVSKVEGCVSSTKSWQEHQRVAADHMLELPRLASDLREALRSEARQLEEHLQDVADLVRGSLWGPTPSQPRQDVQQKCQDGQTLTHLATDVMSIIQESQGDLPAAPCWQAIAAQKYRLTKIDGLPELSSWEWLQSKLGIKEVAEQACREAEADGEGTSSEPCQGDSQHDHLISLPTRPASMRRPMPGNVPVVKIGSTRSLPPANLTSRRMNVDSLVNVAGKVAGSLAPKAPRSSQRQFFSRIAAQEAV